MIFDKEKAKELLVIDCHVREKFKVKEIAEYVGIAETRVQQIINKFLKKKH